MKRLIFLVLICILLLANISFARKSSSAFSYRSNKSTSSSSYKPHKTRSYAHIVKYKAPKAAKKTSYSATGKHKSTYCATCARDKKGRIARSEAIRTAFMKQTGYPHGRKGYIIDHIKPLKESGADDSSNMRWQLKADATAKNKIK